jgi:ribosome modulation factor
MNHLYRAGHAAHAAGAERGANPHHRPADRRAWDNGWCDADFQHEAPPLPILAAGSILVVILLFHFLRIV